MLAEFYPLYPLNPLTELGKRIELIKRIFVLFLHSFTPRQVAAFFYGCGYIFHELGHEQTTSALGSGETGYAS